MESQERFKRMSALACDGCGRVIPTFDPQDMLAAIKGSCPTCGGRFQPATPAREPAPVAADEET